MWLYTESLKIHKISSISPPFFNLAYRQTYECRSKIKAGVIWKHEIPRFHCIWKGFPGNTPPVLFLRCAVSWMVHSRTAAATGLGCTFYERGFSLYERFLVRSALFTGSSTALTSSISAGTNKQLLQDKQWLWCFTERWTVNMYKQLHNLIQEHFHTFPRHKLPKYIFVQAHW